MKNLLYVLVFWHLSSLAQIEVQDAPDDVAPPPATQPTRRNPVHKPDSYFQGRKAERAPASSSSAGRDHYMALAAGGFLSQTQYKWGTRNGDNVGRFNMNVSYRLGGWESSADFLIRADLTTYSLNEGNATKLSFLPMLIFPDADSRFPLYFGAGAGMGVFFQQIRGQSALSFDYQIVAGVRVFDLWESVGLTVETGFKNHIHLLSQGQWNSVFLNAGTVFTF